MGSLKKPHNEVIINFYFARNVNRAMKSGRVGWVRYVACMVQKPEKKRPRVKSVYVFRCEIYVRLSSGIVLGGYGLALFGLECASMAGCYGVHDHEYLGSVSGLQLSS
jgi:hypothetical protein